MRTYRLSAEAEDDIFDLLDYTEDRFGDIARLRYEALLLTGLLDISANHERPGSVIRPELGQDVRTYHLRHSRDRVRGGTVRRPRHILLFRVSRPDLIGVGRVLHDAMEVERHLPSQYGDG
jgi:toxin ParE1/3/4